MLITHFKKGRHFVENGNDYFVLVDNGKDSQNLHICTTIVKAGAVVPEHSHELNDQVYVILSGAAEIKLGDFQCEVSERSVLWIPPGEKHQLKCISNNNFEYIWVANSISQFYPFKKRKNMTYYKIGFRSGMISANSKFSRFKLIDSKNSSKWINIDSVVLHGRRNEQSPYYAKNDTVCLVTCGKGIVHVEDEIDYIGENEMVLIRKGQQYFFGNPGKDEFEYLEISAKCGENFLSRIMDFITRGFFHLPGERAFRQIVKQALSLFG